MARLVVLLSRKQMRGKGVSNCPGMKACCVCICRKRIRCFSIALRTVSSLRRQAASATAGKLRA